MSNFTFDPPNGLLDKNVFPSNPQTEDAARGQFMRIFNQVKDFINNDVVKNDDFELSSDRGYFIFPNGLMICWGARNIVTSQYSGEVEITFPKVFKATPFVITGNHDAGTVVTVTSANIKTAGFLAKAKSTGSGIGAVRVVYVAIGI